MLARGTLIATLLATVALPGLAMAEDRPTLIAAVQSDPIRGTLDPQIEISNAGARMIHNIFDTLIKLDHDNNMALMPGLATAWQRIDDRTVEFTLRDGVTFHDGSPFTAEDVAFTFAPERILSEDWPRAAWMQTYFGSFEAVEVVDPYRVRIVTTEPDPVLEFRLTHTTASIVSQEGFEAAADLESWGRAPVGTGPYRVTEFHADDEIVLEAFDDYWGGQPPAAEIRWVVVPEIAGRIAGLVSGEYGIVTDIPPDQLATIDAYDHLSTTGGPVGNHHVLIFDTSHELLRDVNLRQALSLAIDRDLIVDSLWAGRTTVPASHQWPSFGNLYDQDREPPAYDPELARALVAQSSYDGSVMPFRIRNNYYTNEVPRAEILLEMWRAVGIEAEIEIHDRTADLYGGIRNWSNSMHYPDPVGAICRNWGRSSPMETRGVYSGMDPEPLFANCETLASTIDPEAREQAFRNVLDFWDEQMPGVVLHENAVFYGVREDVDWEAARSLVMNLGPGGLAFR